MKKKVSLCYLKYLFLSMFLTIAGLVLAQPASAAPTVRVQPSGDLFSNAYVITGEARTYFGNVEGGTSPYEYRWELSNGTDTGFLSVGDPRYIPIDSEVFSSAGDHWARLTVRDAALTSSSATIGLKVIAAASDTLDRQKNSAIDRGLRYLYVNEVLTGGNGSFWPGSGEPIGSTGMALIAFENHGHNLQSADSDIYKKSVEGGVLYLLNNAYNVPLSNQVCIGDPEAGDGDADNDGLGVVFTGGGAEMYVSPIAMLALVNSCDEAFAKTLHIPTTSGAVNGVSLWDVIVDAKDFLAYAQNDGSSGAAGYSCGANNTWVAITTNGLSASLSYAYNYLPAICPGQFTINWGDGSPVETVTGFDWYCMDWSYISGLTHEYPAGGTYTVQISHEGVSFCPVEVTVGGDTCQGNNKGWRYTRNYPDSDNSVTQWPVLALEEARDRWHIDVNPLVVTMLNDWLAYSQVGSGGFSYASPGDWVNFPKTAAGLIMLNYGGTLVTDPAIQNALTYLDTSWDWTSMDGNLGNLYGMYAFYKGMKLLGLNDLNSRMWEDIYTENLVTNQLSGGTWGDCCWMDGNFATYTALAILAPAVAGLPPVADAGGPYPDVNAGQTANLDGSGSYHQDPSKNLVEYEWDFDDADGLWWDTKPAPDAGEGAVGITTSTSYPDVGHEQAYTVTLRVTDDNSPVMMDMDTASVNVTTGEVPPVAVTNGPWAGLPGDIITFDGSASYDPNSCTTPGDPACLGDSIVSYEWDLDADGYFNEPVDDGTPIVAGDYSRVSRSYPVPVSFSAVLRVTDSFGRVGITSAQLNIVVITIVFGQQYDTCFRDRINRFEERLGIRVIFKNLGNAEAQNLVMTLMQTPTNLTILKGVANLGNLASGVDVSTSCNPTTKVADIELKFDRRIVPSGNWLWKAEFDFDGSHYVINNIPPFSP